MNQTFLQKEFLFIDMTLVSYVLEPTRTTYPLSYMAELFGTSPVFPDHLDTEEEKSSLHLRISFILFM